MDEAAVALNLMEASSWAEALRPGHIQAAPALFLLIEKASLALFGPSELALRFVSLAAGIAVLFLFARSPGGSSSRFPPLSRRESSQSRTSRSASPRR